jgi:hypothetical protein
MKAYLKANSRELFSYGRKGHRLCGRGYVVVFCTRITVASPRCPSKTATATKGELRYICEDEDKALRILLDDAELFERVRKYNGKSECVVVAFYGLQYTHVVLSRGRSRGH